MELSKNFEPKAIEEKWTRHWKEKRYFNSKVDPNKKPYTVVIPPPNVTGVLHMGHTLNETVQDILVRRARMNGFNACWVPGSDHASIATEAKVVQMLKEKGIDKNNLSREEFLKYAFEWKEKYGNIIYSQIERLGCSVDWDRVTFTMDDHYYKAVIKVFIDLYKKGLIYRGARMIHWDPAAKTALSDEEVEYKEIQAKLFYVKYKVAGSNEFIQIATQRPETIMGDTAVCVHPSDTRYAHLINKKVIVPLVNREVPIIADEYVDKEFGTGALKITPAHDINDYNLGLKYNLPTIDTLNEDGTLSEAAQIFVGMDRFEARKKIVEKLKEEGLLAKEEEYTSRLGFSQRTNAVVEPRISTQWFVKMKELAEPALKEVTEGRIKIHPGEKFLATYKYWLENVKDWCISRQLWWGQRIPAWYDEDGNCLVAESLDELFNQKPETRNRKLKQDEDVLDTWFSSWLWPIEVFKGITNPDNEDINYYYPTSVLVTGQDIIFFWVARMIMAGMEFKNEKPFSDVYFTGMVRDKQGRKMSKQLGNSPDLLELIDKYGADAVRFGIMISSPAGNDLLFDESSLEQGRNFNNKLWNALKLIKEVWQRGEKVYAKRASDDIKGRSLDYEQIGFDTNSQYFAVNWFEERLNEVSVEVNKLFTQFKLSEALKLIYNLIWDDFCSWYLEWLKPETGKIIQSDMYDRTIIFFEKILQLLHPFMPFITEEIYHKLREKEDDLCVALSNKYDTLPDNYSFLLDGTLLKRSITAIRDARNKLKISLKEKIKIRAIPEIPKAYDSIASILSKQTNSEIQFASDKLNTIGTYSVIVGKDIFEIYIEKINLEEEETEIRKELSYLIGFLQSVNNKLNNQKFRQNAKPEIVELEIKKKQDAEAKKNILEDRLSNIEMKKMLDNL